MTGDSVIPTATGIRDHPRDSVLQCHAFADALRREPRHPAHCNALTQDPGSTPGMTNLVVAPAPFLVISAPAGIQTIKQGPRQPLGACDEVRLPQTKHLRTTGAMSPDVRYPFGHRFIPDYAHAPSGLRELESDTAHNNSMPNIHLYRILPLIIYPCEQGKSQ